MKRFFLVLLFSICVLLLFSGQQRSGRTVAVVEVPKKEPLPMPLVVLRSEDMVWPAPGQGDRSTAPRSIVLLGDTKAEELYVMRTLIPKGKQIVPHVHGDSRSVVVISGMYYFGIGETFEASELRAFPPGSFLTEPAGMPHYSWAKDGDVIIQTTAVGPSSTRVLPDERTTEKKNP